MAKTKLEVEADYTEVVQMFSDINKRVDAMEHDVKQMGKATENAFKAPIDEANKLGDTVKKANNTVKDFSNTAKKTGKETKSIFGDMSTAFSVFAGNVLFQVGGKIKQAFGEIFTNNVKLQQSLQNLS